MLSGTSVTNTSVVFSLLCGTGIFLDRVMTVEYQDAFFGISNITPTIDMSKSIEQDSLEDPEQNESIDRIGLVETSQYEASLEKINTLLLTVGFALSTDKWTELYLTST